MPRNRGGRLAWAAVFPPLVMLVGGCGGGGGDGQGITARTTPGTQSAAPELTADDLQRALVQAGDLGEGYQSHQVLDDTSASGCAKTRTGEDQVLAAQLRSFAIEACSGVSLRKETASATATSESHAYLFADADGASRALPVLRASFVATVEPTGGATLGEPEVIPVSGLGDATLPGLKYSIKGTLQSGGLSIYIWRVRNAVAYVGAVDASGDLTAPKVLEVCRKVAARTEAS